MKAWIQKYIDRNLNKDFKWISAIFFFSLSGTYLFFVTKEAAFLGFEMEFVPRIIGLFTLGFLYGNLINFSMSFLISLTGKLFNAKFKFKSTMKSMYVAYKPHLITFLLIIVKLTLAYFSSTNPNFGELLFIKILMVFIDLAIGMIGILSIIILFICLKRTQELSLGKTILNYLAAGILNAPIYIWAIGI